MHFPFCSIEIDSDSDKVSIQQYISLENYCNYSIKPPLSFKPPSNNKPPLKDTFFNKPPSQVLQNQFIQIFGKLWRFKFNISNVYHHVSQLDDLFSSSVFKILIIVFDLQNALNLPGTTSLSSSILAPTGENFRMQLSRVKNLQRRKESSISTCPTSFCPLS